ncbi:hypothetical protein L1D14_04460 [Vibrio tubiashii]|uniref:ParB/RepB/Spo0J family partition protein n=1 Tax=Vibrio tubiashii TaxID=29498 RepID=UPI001EFD6299|nr:hypothetical protein [Vibrio tubiashii]MCG9575485.1 hypothetical protein [Vibrio tubiashii]
MTAITTNPSIVSATSMAKFTDAIKQSGSGDMKKATGEFVINVSDINYTPEWNLRPIDHEHVAEMAEAMDNGEVFDPIEVEMVFVDNQPKFNIVDGYHTYNVIKLLMEQNKHDGQTRATIFKGNEADKLFRAFNSSQNKQLTPYQAAKTFERMLNETNDDGSKVTKSQISARTGKTLSYISNTLFILNADTEMLKLIESGEISPSKAGRLMRKHGEMATPFAKAELGLLAPSSTDSVETEPAPSTTLPSTDSESSQENNSKVKQGESDTRSLKKAAKNATTLRSPTPAKTQSAFELILSMANRLEGDTLTLNSLQLEQLKGLSKYIEEVNNHNAKVTATLAALND